MRCSKCGTNLGKGEVFCPECGIRVAGGVVEGKTTRTPGDAGSDVVDGTQPELPPTGPHAPADLEGVKARNSGFAVASLVLGIVGLTICPLIGAILALIFGLFGKGDIKQSRGAVKGSGMATAGIILGIIGIAAPVIFAAVAIPLGIIFVRPELKATGKILDGASAARVYYFEHGNSFAGMRAGDLHAIDDSVKFRMAPGREPNSVYVDGVTDHSLRLYCYSSRNNKYTAIARGELWYYSFRFWHGTSRWLNDWTNTEDLFK